MSDQEAVFQVIKNVVQAWADNDADRFADQYAADATLISDTYMRDQDHIRSFMSSERGFAGVYKGSVLEVDPMHIRFVRDDVAIVTTQGSITFPSLPAAEAKKDFLGTVVMVKGENGWKFSAYQNSKKPE
jgi:uncharacterized protein (TIGR02246 family)